MNFPLLIFQETEYTGITGVIYQFHGTKKRVFSSNILFCVLDGFVSFRMSKDSFSLSKGDVFFLAESTGIELSAELTHILLISIPSSTLMNHQNNITCNSSSASDKNIFLSITNIISQIIQSEYYGGAFYQLQQRSLLTQLTYELLSTFCNTGTILSASFDSTLSGSPAEKKEQEFSKILDFIDREYPENLKLKELAEAYYYTPSNLSKLFVKYTGVCFHEYLTDLRLRKAMPLLIQTRLEIGFIAEKTGFPNPRAFQQAFQQKYHLRPSEYRNSYQQTTSDYMHNSRSNINTAKNAGLLDIFFRQKSEKRSSSFVHSYLGRYNINHTFSTDISTKNNVLNVNRAKDLLLEETQQQIIMMQREIGFHYINCHGFLADDLQIYHGKTLNSEEKSVKNCIEYNFSLYKKIVGFAKNNDLFFILNLGYIPTFLSVTADTTDFRPDNQISMPKEMDQWIYYLHEFFSYLKKEFGDWLLSCPVLLWQVPDVLIQLITNNITQEDFFHLYQITYQTIKDILPDIEIGSPTISCSQSGLVFARDFLTYCVKNNCMPDCVNITYIESDQSHRRFHNYKADCDRFTSELRGYLRTICQNEYMPFHVIEYYTTLDLSDSCDSMIGAMFPLRFTVQNLRLFERFGYWSLSDMTTESVYGTTQFSGVRGVFSNVGGRKPVFYSLQYLSKLKKQCFGMGDGFIFTKDSHSIQLLLYYDIPESNWVEPFSQEHAIAFYEMHLDKLVSFDLTDIKDGNYIIREQYLNYASGSGFETWISECGLFLAQNGLDTKIYDSSPKINAYSVAVENNTLHYEVKLKPFELRFTEILW